MGNLVVKNKRGSILVTLTDVPDKDAYFIERQPACSLGEYLRLLVYFEELGLTLYEKPGK